jgi:hypothetical protein
MMRRILALSVLVGVLAGSAACNSADSDSTPGATSTSEATGVDSALVAARTDACGTVKTARDASMEKTINAVAMLADDSFGDSELRKATAVATTALKIFGPEITKAAGQTADPALKNALTDFATAISAAAAALPAAGADRTKLNAAWGESFAAAEQTVLDLCFDVWFS